LYCYSGQLVGAYLFASSFRSIKKAIPGFKAKKSSILLDEYLNISYQAAALGFGVLVSAALYALELYDPFAIEQSRIASILLKSTSLSSLDFLSSYSLLSLQSWHPVYSGIIIGLLQLFLTASLGMQLGNSSQYVYLSGFLGKQILSAESYAAYFAPVSGKTSSFGQAVSSIGTVFGKFL
jgi:hypothetical protein